MPASGKMLKSRQQAANRAAGIGDEQGRLPSRVKAAAVMANCTQCMTEIKMTKTNTEAKTHWEARHPACTFATCFPGQFDPTVAPVPVVGGGGESKTGGTTTKKAAKTNDLSFLDDALKPSKK